MKLKFYKLLDKFIIKFSDRVFCDSNSQAEFISSSLKTKKPVVFIGPSRSDIAKFIKLKNFGKVFKNGEKPNKILKSIEIISNLSSLNRESNYDKNPKEIVKFVLN